jgi:eukaryotic-like serine/threonine-protein kinase
LTPTDRTSAIAAALRDRYRVERELGHGGMATVYLAHDLRHDRPVALKVLHPGLARSLGAERFLREIHIAARLQHPAILSVHDSGESAGLLWFTMPFIEGESLRERLRREKQLPTDDAIRIAREAAEALDYAHRHGVIHRDVKPDNILLYEGRALVADFGISRALGAPGPEERLTEPGVTLGTPAYMSPEQASGEPMLDARTDIYSLGAVLYEMLAGEPPFIGATIQSVIAKRFAGEPTPLRALRPGVPETLEHTSQKALAVVPADRFASAAEFARALAESLSATAATTVIPVAAGRPRRRVPLALVLGVGILIGLGVLFAWQRAQLRGGAAETGVKRLAVLPFENLGGPDEAYFADGITDEIRGKLAAVEGLQVTARTSSSRYRKTTESPERIGRELGVDYLLTGTVRWDRDGGEPRVRVSPELVKVATGSTRWQQPFDAPLTDVFAVQGDVAARVARELGVALAAEQRRHLAERPTRSIEAYELYLKGRHAWHQRTAEALAQARKLFERAIALDPGFALAHAGLADVYTVTSLWSDVPPGETFPRAKAAALEALSLDSTLAEPLAALADVNAMYEWDWASAERHFRRSLAFDPNNANTHHWYGGDFLLTVGRIDEAVREARRARELDPLSPTINASLGITLYRAGRIEEARAQLEATRSLDPDFILLNLALGEILLAEERYREAIATFERSVDPKVRHSGDLAFLGYAYAKAGKRREAEALLSELLDRDAADYVGATNVALLHAGIGDTVEVFRWLDRAARERDPFLVYVFVNDPLLAPFKQAPRGAAILEVMGLPR